MVGTLACSLKYSPEMTLQLTLKNKNTLFQMERIKIKFFFISAPRVVPENVSAVATGNSTIHVKWSPTDAPFISGFEGYSIKYEAVGQPGRNREALVVGNINEKSLTELSMFTKYKIEVAARTTQVGNYSDAVYETTLEGGKYQNYPP